MKLSAPLAALAALLRSHQASAYDQSHEAEYLANFPSIASLSHSDLQNANAPAGLLSNCVNQGKLSSALVDVTVSSTGGSISSIEVQSQCGVGHHCIIPQNVTLVMESDLNVGALSLDGGALDWNDSDGGGGTTPSGYYLCAGYILANGPTSNFEVDLQNGSSRGWIYIKNNGGRPGRYVMLGERVLGTDMGGNMIIKGKEKKRTWSLLREPFANGQSTLKLIHDVNMMGWEVGDRIGVAPTVHSSEGTGQSFTITSLVDAHTLQLSSANTNTQTYEATFINGHTSSPPVLKSAEVINLSRNVIITGDDFEQVPCDPTVTSNEETSSMGCKCSGIRSSCTVGLHTIHHSHGTSGVMQISNARVEKCGQRGIEGKYCLHFHKSGDCPDCLFSGNAVEYGHHRGLTVHGTHRSTVTNNVVWDVRGANFYIEDGNEMHNDISYNVAVCPHSLNDQIMQGCSIPGTSTPGADAPNAAFYSKAATNDWTGNRAANTYNGMLLDAGTRGAAQGNVCASDAALGRWVGNTAHGCSRFGLYSLGHGGNYPKHTDRSIATNGLNQNQDLCEGFDSTEATNPGTTDRGYPAAFYENVDYHNVFVGHYSTGDIQHRAHSSINNLNLIYWKETKNFADGCSSHFFGSFYQDGNMAFPDQGSIIISKTKFGQNTHLESNHHCDVGVTGLLCMPQYIFDNVEWDNQSSNKWVSLKRGFNDDGGIYSTAPGQEGSIGFFPQGYTSLAGATYSYLLASPGPRKCIDSTPTHGNRYDNGILCNAPLRSFKIYSRGVVAAIAPMLKVEVWFNNWGLAGQNGPANAEQLVGFHDIGGTPKQGYSFPIISGLEQSYRISLYDPNDQSTSDIPLDWVIEFSDPVIGNRFDVDDQVYVNILGRSCGANGNGLISSQHDRKFLWSGDHFIDDVAWGNNGACTSSPDMIPVDCSALVGGIVNDEGSIAATECPELCASSPCDSLNSYCHCGTPNTCMCKPGFTGPNCSVDVCSSASCGAHGSCIAKHLGGKGDVLIDTSVACICEEGWSGQTCDFNPCEVGETARTCSGSGTCVSLNGVTTFCECEPGYLGDNCESHNIALGKISSTSSQIQPSADAFDGNNGSRWESVHLVDDVSLTVDLGSIYNLEKISIYWEASAARQYQIEVSDDGAAFASAWSTANGASGLIDSVISASGRFVRMHATERVLAPYGYSIFEMQVFGTMGPTPLPTAWPTYKIITLSPTASAQPTITSSESPSASPSAKNLLLSQGKTSTASSVNAGNIASFAVDGNPGSRWESVHGINDEWLQVDLGDIFHLYRVMTHWENACAKVYDIQVSNDGVSFTTVWSKSDGTFGMGAIESALGGVIGRYVRMQGIERASTYGYSIFELEVYGFSPCGGDGCGENGSCVRTGLTDHTCKCDEDWSGETCDTTCAGYCTGGGGVYPYGCATNLAGKVEYGCLPAGGCNYLSEGESYPSAQFCTYKEVVNEYTPPAPTPNPTQPTTPAPTPNPTQPTGTNGPTASPTTGQPTGFLPCGGGCNGHGNCVQTGPAEFKCKCDTDWSGENCETTCAGYCDIADGSVYPYGCATNLVDRVKYGCLPNGGCAYLFEGESFTNENICTFKEVVNEYTTPAPIPGPVGTNGPTASPSKAPSASPTSVPTTNPSKAPSGSPTVTPSKAPSGSPTATPSKAPSGSPTAAPSKAPSGSPSGQPTKNPTEAPTKDPTKNPTNAPTKAPDELNGVCSDGTVGASCSETDMSQCDCNDPFVRRKLRGKETARNTARKLGKPPKTPAPTDSSAPPPTKSPTSSPTGSPIECTCLLPTPSKSPTPPPTNAPTPPTPSCGTTGDSCGSNGDCCGSSKCRNSQCE